MRGRLPGPVRGRGGARALRRKPMPGLAALACAGLIALAGCGNADQVAEPSASASQGAVPEHETAQPAEETLTPGHDAEPTGQTDVAPAPAPLPVAVEIPAIDVHADLVGLGLNDDGSMEVPDFGLAGWYAEGPPPGAAGPAVIVAHYDSTDGPDVFYHLGDLEAGDPIHVHREDGSTATFRVDEVGQYPKDELPGDRIWAATATPRLTLITCGGTFNRSTGHYTDNVIVYATADPSRSVP